MARVQVPSLWDFFITVMGMFGGPLAGVFFLAVFQPQLGSRQVWIGVIAAVAAVGWLVLGTTANGLLAGAVGWAVCVLVALAATVLMPAPATAPDNAFVPETRAV
jgi:SSS family solute:Na+ symporter